jgi:hypothetical protein
VVPELPIAQWDGVTGNSERAPAGEPLSREGNEPSEACAPGHRPCAEAGAAP